MVSSASSTERERDLVLEEEEEEKVSIYICNLISNVLNCELLNWEEVIST
jgi:hypothetical protein